MATPLDITLLKQFDIIFPFIFVITVVYAILMQMGLFKENKTWAALIALSLAVLTVFSDITVTAINYMAPWTILLVILCVLVLLAVTALGPTQQDIMSVLKSKDYDFIVYILVGVVLLIGVGSFAKAVIESGTFGPSAAMSVQEEIFYSTMFHPKVMGLVFILIIAFFTIQRLSSRMR